MNEPERATHPREMSCVRRLRGWEEMSNHGVRDKDKEEMMIGARVS